MDGSFVFWTVLAALVPLGCESTVFSSVHFCKVFSRPQETQQPSENTKVIKFDGIGFPYTTNNSTAGSLSAAAVVNPDEDSTSEENKSTTEKRASEDNASEELMITSEEITHSKTMTRKSASCRCEIKSAVLFRIRIVQVWPQSHIHNLSLHMNSSGADMKNVSVSESWNETFQNTSVTVSIADDGSLAFYTVIMDVAGNSTSVTCTESDVVSSREEAGKIDGSNKIQAVKLNAELIFEVPLLVFGGVLAVIGSLMLITSIAVLRRYRKQRKRHRKCAKANKKRGDQHRRGSYEMCTNETEPSIRRRPTSDSDHSVRKFSTTTVSHSEVQANQAASPQPVIKSTASDKCKHKTRGFFGAKKEQESAKTSNKCVADCEDGHYSEVEVNYEETCEEPITSLTMRDTRVATPLVFVKAGGQQHMLRKTDHFNKAKTTSLPWTEINSENNGYSHLDRLGNLRSHCLRNQNRDSVDSSNTGVYPATDVRNSTGVLNVNIISSGKPKEVVGIMKDEERMVTSEIINEEEQDHIYEDYEEQNVIKRQQNNIKPTNNSCLTTEPKPANNSHQSQEGADQNWRDSTMKSHEVIQQDLTDNKCHDGDNVDNAGKQNTEREAMVEEHKEIHSNETGKKSSLVSDNKVKERPKPMVRQSVARVPPDETEHQADTQASRKSKTDCKEFNSKDTDDQTQIIKATKDEKEARLNSKYINIIPVNMSLNANRQFSVEDQANQHETQENEGTSNKSSNCCSDTNSQPHITETEAFPTDIQLHADCMSTPPSGRYVNMDSHLNDSNGGNENEIQRDARISNIDSDISASDLTKSVSSNSPETNTAILLDVEPEAKTEDRTNNDPATLPNGQPDAQTESHSVVVDGEVYTVVDNIVYGSWPLTEL